MNTIILDDNILFSQGIEKIILNRFSDSNIKIFNSIKSLKEALESIDDVDIFISDLELPNEDIFGFIEEFKNKFESVPILAITMHNKFSVIKKCR